MEYFDGFRTPIGRLHLVVNDQAILRLYLPDDTWSERYIRQPRHPLMIRAKEQVREYFTGKRTHFDLPLTPAGTEFQKRIWGVLQTIPYGMTISYSEEAKRAGKASAVRAVASANAANPIPIIIPCHRVIEGGGNIGGYRGGKAIKEQLLDLEAHHSLRNIPGIGPSLENDLRMIGIERAHDLIGKDPESLYRLLEQTTRMHQDRCVLYVFRAAIYYVSHDAHDPELLKWWNWSDEHLAKKS